MKVKSALALGVLSLIAIPSSLVHSGSSLPNPNTTINGNGTLSTFSTSTPIDFNNAFFKNLGTNGRTCASCHVPSAAWGITPPELQARFDATQGTDPIFRRVDGANCPSADVSTLDARRSAYSQLLEKGLIRVSLNVPASADFQIIAVDDPYHCPQTTQSQPALYRRPLPSTNLPFLTTVMWDGRESFPGRSVNENLHHQALDATAGHAEGLTGPTEDQLQEIVTFESTIYTTQQIDRGAGTLSAAGGQGGTHALAKQDFYLGINDVLGADPQGKPFDSSAFTIFKQWEGSPDPHKAAIARGEGLFNNFPITITGVSGLNDLPGLSTVNGTCTTCHDTPNVGNHSVPLAINIGITDFPAVGGLDVAGLPVYTVQCINSGRTVQVTDLGRAMITGKCSDVGKTKGPVLRGLSARAPYFHNGGAKTLLDAVNFYDARFHLALTDQQKSDLVAFLKAL